MLTEANKAVARDFYEAIKAYNEGDELALERVLAPSFVNHRPLAGQTPDIEGLKLPAFHQAFSQIHVTILDQIAEEDKVVDVTAWSLLHTGEFMGVPATGKRISYTEINVLRVVDGMVVERWGLPDEIHILQQLGIVSLQA
ncbi:ester cyclase [Ktedonobacter racemifer]|uniref:Ester cyclase n=1 Tax=Ktedonobacter racemifer DSM 44963 TaxID=485913 RepID=D6U1D7_KTERA|nr:ester cyclase [Ktedonobacter racemifer]EFH80788.1 protein of unknown function DUF1486 [Ktedonobacter racemifer DSM 44963]